MGGPVNPVKGEFYINNVNADFYLFENPSPTWDLKGRLMRANVVGVVSEWSYPFTDGQIFELAPGQNDTHFYPLFSNARSSLSADFPPQAECQIVLTDDLAAYLGQGKRVVCVADVSPDLHDAVLTFNDIVVPAHTPLWLVMPAAADPTMAGLRALFAGEAK